MEIYDREYTDTEQSTSVAAIAGALFEQLLAKANEVRKSAHAERTTDPGLKASTSAGETEGESEGKGKAEHSSHLPKQTLTDFALTGTHHLAHDQHTEPRGAFSDRIPDRARVESTSIAGTDYEVEYDSRGTAIRHTDSQGVWQSTDGNNWQNEKTGKRWHGEVSIRDGNISFSQENSYCLTKQKNGFSTESCFVAGVHYERTCNEKGVPVSFNEGFGQWVSTDGKNWTNKDTGKTWAGTVSFDAEKGMSVIGADGFTVRHKPDPNGEWTTQDNNRWTHSKSAEVFYGQISSPEPGVLKFNSYEHVETIVNPDGTTIRSFNLGSVKYALTQDETGTSRSFSNEQGKWTSPDGKHWTSDKGHTFDGKVSLDKHGALLVEYINGDSCTHRVDGTVEQSRTFGGMKYELITRPGYGGSTFKDTSGEWNSSDGKHWRNRATGEKWDGTIALSAVGLERIGEDFSCFRHNQRGETEQSVTIGGTYYSIFKDKDGVPRCHFDADGRWESDDGKNWSLYQNNKKIRDWKGAVSFDRDGRIKFESDSGAFTAKGNQDRIDGLKIGETIYQVVTNSKGIPVSHTDSAGEWKSEDGKHWTNVTSGKTWNGSVSVGKDYIEFKGDNGQSLKRMLDGSTEETTRQPGSKVTVKFDEKSHTWTRTDAAGEWKSLDNKTWKNTETEKGLADGWKEHILTILNPTRSMHQDLVQIGGWTSDELDPGRLVTIDEVNNLKTALYRAKHELPERDFADLVKQLSRHAKGLFQVEEHNGEVQSINFGYQRKWEIFNQSWVHDRSQRWNDHVGAVHFGTGHFSGYYRGVVQTLADASQDLNDAEFKAFAEKIKKGTNGSFNFTTKPDGTIDKITLGDTTVFSSGPRQEQCIPASEFETRANGLFPLIDTNDDGFMDDDELAAAMQSNQYTGVDAQVLAALYEKENRDEFKKLHTDTRAWESEKGITRNDLHQFAALLSVKGHVEPNKKFDTLLERVQFVMKRTEQAQLPDVTSLYATRNPLRSIVPDAIKQGTIGNCYFEAALASLAKANPEAIKDMINDNGDGTYTVTFPGDRAHPVTISAPTESERGLYNKGTPRGVWACVIEKAYGAYRREHDLWSTGNIPSEGSDGGGSLSTAIEILTGHSSDGDMIWCTRDDVLRQKLTSAFQNGRIVTAGSTTDLTSKIPLIGSDEDKTADGFPGGHAYSIIGWDPDGPDGGTVTIRNPWGGADGTTSGTISISFNKMKANFSDLCFEE